MKLKTIATAALLFSQTFVFAQWSVTSNPSLNGSAYMSGNMFIGPSGLGISQAGTPPVITTPDRKLNIFKEVFGGFNDEIPGAFAASNTGLKIVHKVIHPSPQNYNWDIAVDQKNMYFHYANDQKTIVTMNKGGKVGIGTVIPKGTLQINSARPILFNSNGGQGVYGSEIGFNTYLNTDVVPNQLVKLAGTNQQGGAIQVVDHYGNMFFQTYDGNGQYNQSTVDFVPNVTFMNNGNVGIGTKNTQGYKLAVKGNVIAEEIVVKLYADWPDFVFTKEYGLMDLNQVENYINENSHLPNVPSANEVKEKGINLGEMDAILLQKIEELTLYVIDLKKEIDTLKK